MIMRGRVIRCLALFIIFFLSKISAYSKEQPISIRIGVFVGLRTEKPVLKQMTVYSPSSHRELELLRDRIAGPEPELRAAIVDTLLDTVDVESLDNLGLFKGNWPGKDKILTWRMADRGVAFLFRCQPQWLSPGKLALQMSFLASDEVPLRDNMKREELAQKVLEATQQEDKMQKILEEQLVLEQNEPVILGIPYKDRAYFIFISWTSASPGIESKTFSEAEDRPKGDAINVPSPLHQVRPAYPKELREQGIRGEVKLRISIDTKGEVKDVEVVKSLHPYLDYASVRALLRWKFDPILSEGKPVALTTVLTCIFDPEKYAQAEQSTEAEKGRRPVPKPFAQDELLRILEQSAEYCRKLDNSALDFICEEIIKETHYYMNTERKKGPLSLVKEGWGRNPDGTLRYEATYSRYSVVDSTRINRNQYVCDYQLVKKGGRIEERRIILKENGRNIAIQKKLLEQIRFSVLRPLFAAVKLLGKDYQQQFDYRILDEDKIIGEKAYVIEAMPRSEDVGSVEKAKIWVDKRDFRILKLEIEGVPLEGYDDVWKEATAFAIKPEARITHIYQFGRKGVYFPSRSLFRIEFPLPEPLGRMLKLNLDMKYEKYKLFTVETEHEIIK